MYLQKVVLGNNAIRKIRASFGTAAPTVGVSVETIAYEFISSHLRGGEASAGGHQLLNGIDFLQLLLQPNAPQTLRCPYYRKEP